MNQLEFWSSVIKSITWPIVVLTTMLIFKKPVTELIEKVANFSLKFRGFEATSNFSQGLQKAALELEGPDTDQSESDASQTNEKQSPKSSNADLKGSLVINNDGSNANFYNIASEAPYLAIIMSFQLLEQELNSVIKKLNIDSKNVKYHAVGIMKQLVNKGYLDQNYYEGFRELNSLRNYAVHNPVEAQKLSYTDAIKYNRLTKKLIKRLQNIHVN
ncbi:MULTISPECIES: HepT-like ribonuclease domain-containing protein [Bacillus]|uniref:HepT-like ribonuclease domain-containing protein n=1 Tax=Bacillus TaxID=1386 RepID=UPI000312F1A9|nr:HepT-like ribonuclease domain-containing protein [Bacillus licheniformis]